ncbi:MAG: multicopper oxidase domain-containing protein [Actinomycetota bacterium]|nr:multicopper oxidase domain-containing protein [Actinomycetota bacterium]
MRGVCRPAAGYQRGRLVYARTVGMAAAVGVLVAGCSGSSAASPSRQSSDVTSQYGTEYENTGTGPMTAPAIPVTPSVPTDRGAKQGNTRTFTLTASQFSQQIANFPLKTATVWGYNGSTPGPTLIAYQGEQLKIVVTNQLPEPTTVHFHGLHEPNAADGVAGISQPDPIAPGQTYTYTFTPGHVGTFAYHSHFDGAVQELRGLDGALIVLPAQEHQSVHVDEDVMMTLQQFDPPGEDGLVKPFGESGQFPFSTINGKTGDASGGPITIHRGDRVRIRVYNASNLPHSMHLHGHDEILVAKNGHAVTPTRETTDTVGPGDFAMIEFTADNPGNWIFHCHFPHHTANAMTAGYNGAPVGMTRIFHYSDYAPVPTQYFSPAHYKSPTTGS